MIRKALPDDLHPDAEGYKIMGQNFVDKVASRFFVKDATP